jgi:hypothetical protein
LPPRRKAKTDDLPTICAFYGIVIQMFSHDQRARALPRDICRGRGQVDIRTLGVIESGVLKRTLALELEWALEHRTESMED